MSWNNMKIKCIPSLENLKKKLENHINKNSENTFYDS